MSTHPDDALRELGELGDADSVTLAADACEWQEKDEGSVRAQEGATARERKQGHAPGSTV